MKKLEDLILTYKDFPKKGIDFKDVLEILQYPEIFHDLILKMSSNEFLKNAEAIISIDARGFIFGSAVALQLSKPMIVARKPGKLPGHILTREYDLEYGKNSLSIQSNALKKFNSFVIVDDLLATGGTVNCVSKMLQDQRKEILGLITVIELNKLKGRSKFDFPVQSIISIDARGFIFGSALALESSKPMIVARKPGKLPGKILTREYDLEYGKNSLSIQSNALKKFNSFVIVDDF